MKVFVQAQLEHLIDRDWNAFQSRSEFSFHCDWNMISHLVRWPVIGLILTTIELAFDCVQNHFDCD